MGEFEHRVLITPDKPSNFVYPASGAAHMSRGFSCFHQKQVHYNTVDSYNDVLQGVQNNLLKFN